MTPATGSLQGRVYPLVLVRPDSPSRLRQAPQNGRLSHHAGEGSIPRPSPLEVAAAANAGVAQTQARATQRVRATASHRF